MSAAGPSARRAIGGAALDGAFYLYGGFGVRGTTAFDYIGGDLWRWDGGWHRLSVAPGESPSGRYTAALAPSDRSLLMFGGHAQNSARDKFYFADLWCFDPDAMRWQRLDPPGQGPGRRYGFGWVANDETLYVFGGFDGDRGDLWALDLQSLRWQLLAPESADTGPASRYCPALGKVSDHLVLFGGRSKTDAKRNFSDCWQFDGSWRAIDEARPGYHAKPGYASDGAAFWLFGGEGPRGHVGDLWRYDRNGWSELHKSPENAPVLW